MPYQVQMILGIDGAVSGEFGPERWGWATYVWTPREDERPMDFGKYPLFLEVDGYPEKRSPHEKNSVVTIRLKRMGVPDSLGLIYETTVTLHSLRKRPELVRSEFAELTHPWLDINGGASNEH